MSQGTQMYIEFDEAPVEGVSPFACKWDPGVRRDRPYVVAYTPWEAPTRIVSSHHAPSAARAAAEQSTRQFRAKHPEGFGHSWTACTLHAPGEGIAGAVCSPLAPPVVA